MYKSDGRLKVNFLGLNVWCTKLTLRRLLGSHAGGFVICNTVYTQSPFIPYALLKIAGKGRATDACNIEIFGCPQVLFLVVSYIRNN